MTDLLTHALVVYILATPGTWRLDWFHRRHVGIAMLGTIFPDTAKGLLLTGPEVVLFGIEASWYALQTVGASVVFIGASVLLFDVDERPAVLGSLSFGVLVHMFLDLLVIRADGTAPPYLYPLTWWHLPSGNVYLSSDIWPSLVTIGVGILVWHIDRSRLRD